MRQNHVKLLINHRAILLAKAGDLEKKSDVPGVAGVFVNILINCIPKGIGGRVRQT